MHQLLKTYMLTIYKITGKFYVDEFFEFNCLDNENLLNEIKEEILSDLSKLNLKENIINDTIRVKGSLNKTLLIAELLKNHQYQLEHEQII